MCLCVLMCAELVRNGKLSSVFGQFRFKKQGGADKLKVRCRGMLEYMFEYVGGGEINTKVLAWCAYVQLCSNTLVVVK